MIEDSEEAICRARQGGVGTASKYHPNLAGWLKNQGNKLERRFQRTGWMEDLKESIRRAQQAANITPQYHRDLANWFEQL